MDPKVFENGTLHFSSKGLSEVCSVHKKGMQPSKCLYGKAKCRYASLVEIKSKHDKLDLALRVVESRWGILLVDG